MQFRPVKEQLDIVRLVDYFVEYYCRIVKELSFGYK